MKRVLLLVATMVCSLSMFAQSEVAEAPQTDAVYRLPFDKGVECVAYSLSAVRLNLARNYNMVDFCAWELIPSEPTSVVAPREGVIEKVEGSMVLIRHPENIYTRLRGVEAPIVEEGQQVRKGDTLAPVAEGVELCMEVFYQVPNPKLGTVSLGGKGKYLTYYINPIFSTRAKCKVQLTSGNSYTTKARTWCLPWE